MNKETFIKLWLPKYHTAHTQQELSDDIDRLISPLKDSNTELADCLNMVMDITGGTSGFSEETFKKFKKALKTYKKLK